MREAVARRDYWIVAIAGGEISCKLNRKILELGVVKKMRLNEDEEKVHWKSKMRSAASESGPCSSLALRVTRWSDLGRRV